MAAVCFALALPAAAQTPRKFGVLSLIGDSFVIVKHESATAEGPAVARLTVVDLPEHAFDNSVAADVEEAIKSAAPGARVVALAGAKMLYSREGDSVDDPRAVLARSQRAIVAAGVTHLVLLTKMRRRADVPLDPKEAEMQVDGLGFYMDEAARTGGSDAPAAGYLAPYAFFRVWLVDVAREKVIGFREVADLSPVARNSNSTTSVWDTLSSAEKVQMVHSLVRKGTQSAVYELIRNMPD